MPVDPPHIDRDRLCREERARRHVRALLRQSRGMLTAGECLGDPYREDDRIVIPILKAEDDPRHTPDPLTMHALVAAWLDDPDL